jgi:hypothetical protein
MGRHIVCLTILAEFGRALAATRRYEVPRCGRACHDGLAHTDIPRRIFAEFYARRCDTEHGARVSGSTPLDRRRKRRNQSPMTTTWHPKTTAAKLSGT